MVSFTATIEWQTRQPIPAWACGVSICCTIGVSIRPVRSTAWSWQPPHHLDGFVPTTSCMYSIDLRYHWLLNDEKWCIDDSHCAVMSGWHPLLPHAFDSRKKSCGIKRSPTVVTDEGKNGLRSPPPSSNGVRGGVAGLTIAAAGGGRSHACARTPSGRTSAAARMAATRCAPTRLPRADCQAIPASSARSAAPTWVTRIDRYGVAVPVTARTRLAAIDTIEAAATAPSQARGTAVPPRGQKRGRGVPPRAARDTNRRR